MLWYMIWYDIIWYDMIWYMIWYDMIYDTIWYDIWYDTIWYDMIYLTATGLSPGGSSTVHIYTQTIHRTTQNKQHIEQHKTIHRTTHAQNAQQYIHPSLTTSLNKTYLSTFFKLQFWSSLKMNKTAWAPRWSVILQFCTWLLSELY